MKICDVYQKQVNRLEYAPPEASSLEVCQECSRNLMDRFVVAEKQMMESRYQLQYEVVARGQRERAPATQVKG